MRNDSKRAGEMMEKQCGREEATDKRGVNWRMMVEQLGRDKPSKGEHLGRDKPRVMNLKMRG